MSERPTIGSIWENEQGEQFRITGVSNEPEPWVTLRRISDGVAFTKSLPMLQRSLKQIS